MKRRMQRQDEENLTDSDEYEDDDGNYFDDYSGGYAPQESGMQMGGNMQQDMNSGTPNSQMQMNAGFAGVGSVPPMSPQRMYDENTYMAGPASMPGPRAPSPRQAPSPRSGQQQIGGWRS